MGTDHVFQTGKRGLSPFMTRELAYYEAKLEGLRELLAAEERVHFITEIATGFLGLSPHRVHFRQIASSFPDRVIAPPISELAFCGVAIGAAMARGAAVGDFITYGRALDTG